LNGLILLIFAVQNPSDIGTTDAVIRRIMSSTVGDIVVVVIVGGEKNIVTVIVIIHIFRYFYVKAVKY
jgi:hypothetical protein